MFQQNLNSIPACLPCFYTNHCLFSSLPNMSAVPLIFFPTFNSWSMFALFVLFCLSHGVWRWIYRLVRLQTHLNLWIQWWIQFSMKSFLRVLCQCVVKMQPVHATMQLRCGVIGSLRNPVLISVKKKSVTVFLHANICTWKPLFRSHIHSQSIWIKTDTAYCKMCPRFDRIALIDIFIQ